MAFSGSVVSEDFCEAFRTEGNRISYLYKQGLVDGKYVNQSGHVIINGKAWDFVFVTTEINLIFNRSVSQLAPVFTNQYMGAACFWIGGPQGKCDTMLFPKGDTITKVMVTRIANNDYKGIKPLAEFSKPEEKTVKGLPKRNYSFVFSDSHENQIYFVIGPTPGKTFTWLYYKFELNGEKAFDVSVTSDKYSTHTLDFNMEREVIGMMYQWGHGHFGHIFLLKDNQVVYWCWRMVHKNEVCMTQNTMTNTLTLITISVRADTPSGQLYRPQSQDNYSHDHSRWRSSSR